MHLNPVAMGLCGVPPRRLLEVNARFLALFDLDPETVIGLPMGELGIWDTAEDRERLDQVLNGQNLVSGADCKFHTRSGGLRVAQVFLHRMELSHMSCAILMAYDITDRPDHDPQAPKAQKLAVEQRVDWLAR